MNLAIRIHFKDKIRIIIIIIIIIIIMIIIIIIIVIIIIIRSPKFFAAADSLSTSQFTLIY